MRKHNSNSNEHLEAWDDGTYQTGACKHEKHSSALVPGLLAAVILLGGLASAMGMMNIRLLSRLRAQENEAVPMRFTTTSDATDSLGAVLRTNESPLPQVPSGAALQVELQSVPKEVGVQSMSQREIFAANQASFVTITCDTHYHTQRRGLGVIVSERGYILTNASSADHSDRIFVQLSDGRSLRAALVGMDEFTDLAVLYVEAEDLQPVSLGYARNLTVGDPVYSISDAVTMEVASGEISATELELSEKSGSFLQSTVGSDFGPVFSQWGQMIGFNVGHVARYFDLEQGDGLTLSSEVLRDILAQLTGKGAVTGRPSLGVQVRAVSKLYQQYWDLPVGLQVTELESGALAESSGLKLGDILIELDGQRLEEQEDLVAILYQSRPGDSYTATVFRGGEQFTLTLTVEQIP